MNGDVRLGQPSTGVIITGGASGIGLASARALAAVGRPVAIWDIDGQKAESEAEAIAAQSGVASIGVAIDMRQIDAFPGAIERTRAALPSIGGLVHAAGIVDTGSLEGMTPQSWDDGIAVHLRALAFMVQAMIGDLKAHPGSAVVAITSINATLGNHLNPIYTAAKGGMLSLVRSLADRLAQDGVRINSLSPGFVATAMTQFAIDTLSAEHIAKRILLERFGRPEEIGRVARFLLSDEASFITAAELVVDGGNISSQRM